MKIVNVKIPYSNPNQGNKAQRHFAYVEFGDEEAMKAGLAHKGEVCSLVLIQRILLTGGASRNCARQVRKCRLRTRVLVAVDEEGAEVGSR